MWDTFDLEYVRLNGNCPMADHTLFAFPPAKAFASGKIKIGEMCFER